MTVENLYQDLPIADLAVNPENPRLLEGAEDELGAINALLTDIPERMKTLAQDIAKTSFVYDPPLVKKDGRKWKVYDGNRRIACTKLMLNPAITHDPVLRDFFKRLSQNHQGKLPKTVKCRIESDMKVINDILERRHAGGDTGIGQMAWRADEKANFLARAGIPHKARFGTALTTLLKEKNVLKRGDRIKVSIFDRLLNSEVAKNCVGLSFKGNKLNFIADEKKVLKLIKRIVDDAESGFINLNKTWSNAAKEHYFSHLRNEGFLPLSANDAEVKKNAPSSTLAPAPEEEPSGKMKKERPYARPHLIPEGIRFSFDSEKNTARIKNIVIELQSDLFFPKHLNAIAVLFRVLIEMSVDHYIETVPLKIEGKNKYGPTLAEKFDACLTYMVEQKFLTAKDRSVLIKFKQPEQILSADTFHAYLHHRMAHPAQSDLIAMWDQWQPFILRCLSSHDEKQEAAA